METRLVREGEEISVDSLGEYLRSELSLLGKEIDVEQFPAGSSNLTYLVRVGGKEFVLRRPPFGNTVKKAHDMAREFHVLSKLSRVYPPAPAPLLYCEDKSVIGSEFFLMERRHGLIIRGQLCQNHPGEMSTSQTSIAQVATFAESQDFRVTVCRSFIQNLAALHSINIWDLGLADLGKPDGYNHRQVEGWTARYRESQTHDWPELDHTITWINGRVPNESRAAIIHNDYKFDNVMLDPLDLTRVVAVLDWEMATIGDPLMDLGTTLGYWMSSDSPAELLNMPFNPGILMRSITRQQLVEMYAGSLGVDLPDMLFYYVFGTFKIAAIAQQIYARYAKGFTTDRRFANFYEFVAALGLIAAKALDNGSI